jgi:hypothetical protein
MTVGLLSLAQPGNSSRVTINSTSQAYLNLVKSMSFDQQITNISSDGYPVASPTVALLNRGSTKMPGGYYGTFTMSWGGSASLQLNGPAIVVSSGGTVVFSINASSGDQAASSNINIQSQTATAVAVPSATPLVFAFGWNIQSISNNGLGLIRINCKTNYVGSSTSHIQTGIDQNGNVGALVNITGANVNTGANGLWSIINVGASSFDLVGSTFTNAQVGVAGQAIFACSGMSMQFNTSAGYSGFSNWVWAKTGDLAAIAAGQIYDSTLVSQLTTLFNNSRASVSSYGWLRFMDATAVQTSLESNFSNRMPTTQMSYGVNSFVPAFLTSSANATITNGGADAYTCSDASTSVWSGSNYIDGAVILGAPDQTNSTVNPTLNVGGHGAKPIYGLNWDPQFYTCAGSLPASAGLSMVFHFDATWLNGGSTYVFTYTTVAGDALSFSTLNLNIRAALQADATLSAATIQFGNYSGGGNKTTIFSRSAQVQGSGSTGTGPLTVTYTSGPASVTVSRISASSLASVATPDSNGNTTCAFIYNYLLDGWIYQAQSVTRGIPLEAIADLCNRVGAHCWFNFSLASSSSFVSSVANFFATNLNSRLRFGFEVGNENWNPGGHPYYECYGMGSALNFSTNSSNVLVGIQGLRTRQYAAISQSAWTAAGRAASDHYVLQMWQVGNQVSQPFQTIALNGSLFNTSSNAVYAAVGGLGGGAAADYTISPNRPVDYTNAIGEAPYWNSHWLGGGSFTTASQLRGSAASNSPVLQAALDFANGNALTAFTSLVNQFNGTTVRSSGGNSGQNFADFQAFFTDYNTIAASYDGARPAGMPLLGLFDYEGGPSFGMGANGNVGVNSVSFNTVASADITALANQMTTLDSPVGTFTVSPWTQSGTDNKTEMATMILQLLQAWKFDVTNTGVAANTSSYSSMIQTWYYQALKSTASGGREVHPAQYGYAQSNWGFFPGVFDAGDAYKNFNACQQWNAGL